MDYRPLPSTAEAWREWAFDEDWELMEQDEDLIVADVDNIPSLLPLTIIADCPKADYIANCLDAALMWHVQGRRHVPGSLQMAIQVSGELNHPALKAWTSLQERRLSYTKGNGSVDAVLARQMGEELKTVCAMLAG